MDGSEFEGWLQKGLGRVQTFLCKHTATPYREAILHACTHNLAYDRQCEETRGHYLFEIIQLTGEAAFYRDRILAALAAPLEDENEWQLFEIAECMAQEGDEFARQIIRERFVRNAAERCWAGAEEIVRLGGVEGFVFVAAHLAELDFEEDGWECDSWLEMLEEREGKEETRRALQAAEKTNPGVATLVERIDQYRAQWEVKREQWKRERKARPYLDFETLQRLIAEKGRETPRGVLRQWSRNCQDETEIEWAAKELVAETDNDRLLAYLRLFQFKRFPLNPDRLLALARSTDEDITRAALWALEHITHPTVRALVLELVEEAKWSAGVVDLLKSNYQEGDEQIVTRLLARPMDTDCYHWLGIAAREFFKAHPTADRGRAMLLLYENGPCSLCRHGCVELLVEAGKMPEWMREECRYDADLDIRKLVAT